MFKKSWPPSLPDLNVMDFAILSILEKVACQEHHSSMDARRWSPERGRTTSPLKWCRRVALRPGTPKLCHVVIHACGDPIDEFFSCDNSTVGARYMSMSSQVDYLICDSFNNN